MSSMALRPTLTFWIKPWQMSFIARRQSFEGRHGPGGPSLLVLPVVTARCQYMLMSFLHCPLSQNPFTRQQFIVVKVWVLCSSWISAVCLLCVSMNTKPALNCSREGIQNDAVPSLLTQLLGMGCCIYIMPLKLDRTVNTAGMLMHIWMKLWSRQKWVKSGGTQ